MYKFVGFFLTATVFLSSQATAHSWNEQFSLINEKGEYTGPQGYPRGYYARGLDTGGVTLDELMTNQIPSPESGRLRINNDDLLCMDTQQQPVQRDPVNFPRLKVAPGSWVAMKYLENGHVTQPYVNAGKPPMSGTVYVFGTTQPRSDEKLAQVLQWNKKGTGGDGRGRLLTAQNFDDGRCHQPNNETVVGVQRQNKHPNFPVNGGAQAEQWCETNLRMPKDLKPGHTLTIYWVWDWPTSVNTEGIPDGKDQYYTTCSDIDVVAKEPAGPLSYMLPQQDPQVLAVKEYKSRSADTPEPKFKFDSILGNQLYVNPSTVLPTTTITATTPLAPSLQGLSVTAQDNPSTRVWVNMVPYGASAIMPPPTTMITSTTPVASAPAAPVPSTPTTPYVPPAPSTSALYVAPTPATSAPYLPPAPESPTGYQYSSIPLPGTTSAPAAAETGAPPQGANVMTSIMTITITATMEPTQSMLIVTGEHVATFVNPAQQVMPRATGAAAMRGFHRVHAKPRRRRLAA